MLGKMIANGALVQELKLLSDALTPPIIIVQPMPSLLELSLFLMDQGKFPLMSLVSTKNLMSTSIKTDYAPSKMPKSKDFVFVSSRVTSTYIKWPSGVGYYSNFCPSCIYSIRPILSPNFKFLFRSTRISKVCLASPSNFGHLYDFYL